MLNICTSYYVVCNNSLFLNLVTFLKRQHCVTEVASGGKLTIPSSMVAQLMTSRQVPYRRGRCLDDADTRASNTVAARSTTKVRI